MAREIDHPSPHSEPDAWDILADGAVGLGDPARAARLLELGADRARDGGRRDEAGRLRLRAGAIVFQAGDYPEANAICGRVWDDSKSGPSRPKAGMLRVLARGRMIAARSAGTTRAGYLAAMNDLLRDYPNDPSTGEARWLLGANELAAGRPAAAMAHWEAIAPGQPRWISARLAIAEQLQRELDTLRIADNPTVVAESYKSAVSSLRKSLARDAEESESLDLELTLIRLDLTPGVGHPDHARSLCDRVAHRAGSDAQHARARMLRVIALAMIQQFAEAEREARVEGVRASSDDLLLAARLLDHSADATESDVNRSRIGRILRLLLVAGARHLDKLPPAGQAEARLRAIRAEIAVGDTESARRAFTEPNGPNAADLDPDSLRDLADAYFRVEAYGMAIDVERLRIRGLKPGSPEWIESRYGLALALYRDKKPREAQRIIDATAILHPELGGGSLKARFERLRQRIEPE